jgi:CubicO group peptidase (beta-lactamase class C family)
VERPTDRLQELGTRRDRGRRDHPSASYFSYGYFWWLDPDHPGRFYAFGKYGQFIYVAPDADVVVVRFGRGSGVDKVAWLAAFGDVADQLERRP